MNVALTALGKGPSLVAALSPDFRMFKAVILAGSLNVS